MDYLGYVDFHTLALLFALMAVMAGLQGLGLFRSLGERMLNRTRTTRQLEVVLLFLPFLSSMIVTNDVALITFVPFALEVLRMAGLQQRIIPVVAMQTIAANLGSMTRGLEGVSSRKTASSTAAPAVRGSMVEKKSPRDRP